MVSKVTGIPKEFWQGTKREFEDVGLLFEVYKEFCKHTKNTAPIQLQIRHYYQLKP
jgi:hypothetical protein